MKTLVNGKKVLYITLFAVLITLSTLSIVVLQGYWETNRRIQVVYDSKILFHNYIVGNIKLDGEIHGSLVAEYSFYKDIVIIETHYEKYQLKGFNDPGARNYILSLLREKVKRVYSRKNFSRNEIPYPRYKSFILHGGLPYYVEPSFLNIDPIYRQRIIFSTGTNTSILEDRMFKYDPDTGILVESIIKAKIHNGMENEEYTWTLAASSSSNPFYILETMNIEALLTIVALGISILTAILAFYLDKRRGFRQ